VQNRVISSDFILTLMHEVLAEKEKENINEIEEEIKQTNSRSKKLLHKLGDKAPEFIVNNIQLPSFSGQKHDLSDFRYNKMICLNFLSYCLENGKKIQYDLGIFESDADRELLLEYMRSNIYIALSDHYPKKTKTNLEYRQKYGAFRKKIKKKSNAFVLSTENQEYVLPIHHFEEVVFFHRYGIAALPASVKEALVDKDFIDAGAYIGDTALILNELKPNRIYSFEPCTANHLLMQKTLKLNNLKNVVPVRSALGNKECISNLFLWENASFLTDNEGEDVPVTTIDSFQEKNSLNVGLIKMDIEGSEFYAIQGAEKTIKKFKPVLIISVYHSGRDFFEIPKLLKEWVPSYHFRFLSLHKGVPVLERVLLAY
jgi:FkbM family methyltransferase